MSIRSREYKWTAWDLYKDFMLELSRQWWVRLSVISLLVTPILLPWQSAQYVLLPLMMILAVFFLLPLAGGLLFQKNNRRYKTCLFDIGDDFITVYFVDGSQIIIEYDSIQQVVEMHSYYYISLPQQDFFYFPLTAFVAKEDIDGFDSLLKKKVNVIWNL